MPERASSTLVTFGESFTLEWLSTVVNLLQKREDSPSSEDGEVETCSGTHFCGYYCTQSGLCNQVGNRVQTMKKSTRKFLYW